jgi:hypothetical protein
MSFVQMRMGRAHVLLICHIQYSRAQVVAAISPKIMYDVVPTTLTRNTTSPNATALLTRFLTMDDACARELST